MSDTGNAPGVVFGAAGSAPAVNDQVAPMDLSAIPNAQLNDDGSVTLTLTAPLMLTVGTQQAPYESLTFHRLSGADLLKLVKRSNLTAAGIAISARLQEARVALLTDKMAGPDLTRARRIFEEIMGGMGAGLPEHAVVTDEGIELPLRLACVDGDDEPHETLLFRDLTGADLKAIEGAGDRLVPTRLSRCTGLKIKSALVLANAMDAADLWDANRVGRFLGENGRPTGG
jgi:hypothetical protein